MLSDSWCEMADVLGRVASISDVVSNMLLVVLFCPHTLGIVHTGVQTISREGRRHPLGDRRAGLAVRTVC